MICEQPIEKRNEMTNALLSMHHALKYVVFIGLLISLIVAFYAIARKAEFTRRKKAFYFVTRVLLSLQGATGVVIYFLGGYPSLVLHPEGLFSPVGILAIWHPILMILGIVSVNVGFISALKADTDTRKHLRVALFYGLGLFIIGAGIPRF
jgi:hypothetical protein